MAPNNTQSFFTPDPYSSHEDQILSQTYNLAQALLSRVKTNHLFVPISSMKYFTIIEPDQFWFIDSTRHTVQGGEAGRVITVSWKPTISPSQRESMEQPAPCTVTFYGEDQESVQTRIQSELLQAMRQLDQRYPDRLPTAARPRILPLSNNE